MALFLTVHARYKDVQWGLFNEDQLLTSETVESKGMSKQFIELLDSLLRKHGLSLQALSFIAAHQGPAPFTTLRVCLASVNGIAFATGLPLIGINGIDALLDEHRTFTRITVVLLNAFGNDVYYGIFDQEAGTKVLGYAAGEEFLNGLKAQHSLPVTFMGNGCQPYESQIQELFGAQAKIIPIEMVSLKHVAHTALHKWLHKETQNQLMPAYLKDYTVPKLTQ